MPRLIPGRTHAALIAAIAGSALAPALLPPLLGQAKPLVTPKDIAKWESLGATRLSPNGAWISWSISRGNEENDLRVRGGARDTLIVIPNGTSPNFSPDSKWFAYLIGVSPKERDRLTKEKKPIRTSFAVRNLETGETISIPDVTTYSFNPSGGFVAVTKYAADGKRTNDVQTIDLAKGTRLSFNNVSEQAWSETKPLLAMAVTVDGNSGNALQLFDGASGTLRIMETTPSVYRAISWRPKSDALAVLRTNVAKEFSDTAHTILVWTSALASSKPSYTLEANVSGFPAGMRVADYRRPTWARDGRALYFGVQKRQPVADAIKKKSEEKVSDVEIWHTNDVHTIPEQRSGEQRDLRATTLASWRLADAKVVMLGSDAQEATTVLDGDAFAMETDRKPYAFGQKFGRRDQDLWLVDATTGTRRKLFTQSRYSFSPDPAGKRIASFDGTDYWATDIVTGARTNLTAKLRASKGVDLVNRDDDHPVDVLPPIGAPQWAKDGSLLVNSEYDVWAIAPDGSGGRRLTNGAVDSVVHRIVSFAPFNATAAERAIDLTKPMYLSLYGKRSKKNGYAKLLPNGTVQRLLWADAAFGQFIKADSAERYAFTRQRFDESPNVFVAGPELANAKQMSETNPFQKDYAWGKAELMNFTSTIGTPLQAILYYPANYDPAKKYPMVVYTYEMLSQDFHRYIVPRENDYYNANVFTQNGYFVLMPDIVFRPREPGIAVLHSVEPAVRAVVARGLVDSTNVGHMGHSQGGYEAYYLATHSPLFKTAVAGAGISDMWSFAGQMHWTSVPEFDHWETGQFRMQVAPWEDVEAMNRNSPLAKVHEMKAKSILIEIGGDDPVVDMRQGVEFYNYVRRAGKDAVMLLYPGEGHGLGKRENAIDYERRILQWFGYYLKGEEPAEWITKGQTWLQRKAVLDANR